MVEQQIKIEEEIWKDIEGFDGIYKISTYGRVRSMDRLSPMDKSGRMRLLKGKIIYPWKNHRGYILVSLWKSPKRYGISVHILVAKSFVSNPYNKPEVNHLDGDKS